ncbi:MAG TPA: IclR family transcriptional regulator [Clostridia bacterium]|jgi:DNA-binding IclR family transcriptional regulator|nr:IclR family transcriptional regulator [Clostridia bacterium]
MNQVRSLETVNQGEETPYYVINSVIRTLEIINCLSQLGEASVSDVSNCLKMTKSTIHRFLASMKYAGFLEQNPENQKYRLSIKLFEIGNRVIGRLNISEIAKPIMLELAEKTGETVNLAILDGFEVVYIEKCVSQNCLRMDCDIGGRDPAYCTGLGKAMLAFLPEEELDRHLASEKLQAKTINTITVPQALKAELKTIRENGYAVDKEELIQGINCLAAPIRNNENKVVAAISISAPKVRVNKMVFEANKQLLLEAAQLISRKMGAKV